MPQISPAACAMGRAAMSPLSSSKMTSWICNMHRAVCVQVSAVRRHNVSVALRSPIHLQSLNPMYCTSLVLVRLCVPIRKRMVSVSASATHMARAFASTPYTTVACVPSILLSLSLSFSLHLWCVSVSVGFCRSVCVVVCRHRFAPSPRKSKPAPRVHVHLDTTLVERWGGRPSRTARSRTA